MSVSRCSVSWMANRPRGSSALAWAAGRSHHPPSPAEPNHHPLRRQLRVRCPAQDLGDGRRPVFALCVVQRARELLVRQGGQVPVRRRRVLRRESGQEGMPEGFECGYRVNFSVGRGSCAREGDAPRYCGSYSPAPSFLSLLLQLTFGLHSSAGSMLLPSRHLPGRRISPRQLRPVQERPVRLRARPVQGG